MYSVLRRGMCSSESLPLWRWRWPASQSASFARPACHSPPQLFCLNLRPRPLPRPAALLRLRAIRKPNTLAAAVVPLTGGQARKNAGRAPHITPHITCGAPGRITRFIIAASSGEGPPAASATAASATSLRIVTIPASAAITASGARGA